MPNHFILCVDDEPIALESLKAQLKRHFGSEYETEVAENAEEAYEVIEELEEDGFAPALIISDWLMPGVRGDELLINLHKKYPAVVKIMLTGQADRKAIKAAQEKAELAACFDKPWEEAELMGAVRDGLKNFHQQNGA